MSQYKTGSVAVTNSNQAVVGTGTLWLANAAAGQTFIVNGSTVPYVIGSVNSDTSITLSSNYAGATQSGLSYEINTSKTPVLGIDYPEAKDIDTATTLKRAMLQIESMLTTNNYSHGADIASASTVNLDVATGELVDITGTTTVTAITLAEGRQRTVRFTGALTLTHGSSLVLPGAVNITTIAGSYAIFRGYAAGVVRLVFYQIGDLAPFDRRAPGTIGGTTPGDVHAAALSATGTSALAAINASGPISSGINTSGVFAGTFSNTHATGEGVYIITQGTGTESTLEVRSNNGNTNVLVAKNNGAVTMAGTLGVTGAISASGGIGAGANGTTAGVSTYFASDTNIYYCDLGGPNAALAGMKINRIQSTGRSINAAGTINASGADYAEYERKARRSITFAKGDLVGFNAGGLLTDKWTEAVTFGIKSTSPCMIGGDAWGNEEALGIAQPKEPKFNLPDYAGPARPKPLTDEATETETSAYTEAVDAWQAAQPAYWQAIALANIDHAAYMAMFASESERFATILEDARQWVDRIAYSGKVPANVLGAKPGQYIDASSGPNDTIIGVCVPAAGPNTIGRVRCILPDGRAEIVVYVH